MPALNWRRPYVCKSLFAALKETSSYARDSFVDDGGWATLGGMETIVPGAAEVCADELVAMDSIPDLAADTAAVRE